MKIFANHRNSDIPLGVLLPAAEYKSMNSRFRGTVLEQSTEFDPVVCTNARSSKIATFVIDGPRTPMLLFVIQLGDTILSWLADPADPAVWRAIESWNANNAVSVALSRKETHLFVVPLTGRIDKTTLLRPVQPIQSSDIFTNQAIETFSSDALDELTAAYFPVVSNASHCIIHTSGVATSLERQGYRAEYDNEKKRFLARKNLLVYH